MQCRIFLLQKSEEVVCIVVLKQIFYYLKKNNNFVSKLGCTTTIIREGFYIFQEDNNSMFV